MAADEGPPAGLVHPRVGGDPALAEAEALAAVRRTAWFLRLAGVAFSTAFVLALVLALVALDDTAVQRTIIAGVVTWVPLTAYQLTLRLPHWARRLPAGLDRGEVTSVKTGVLHARGAAGATVEAPLPRRLAVSVGDPVWMTVSSRDRQSTAVVIGTAGTPRVTVGHVRTVGRRAR